MPIIQTVLCFQEAEYLSLACFLTHSFALSQSLTHSLSHLLIHFLFLSLSLSLSLSFSLTHLLSISHSLSLSLTRSLTHFLFLTLSLSPPSLYLSLSLVRALNRVNMTLTEIGTDLELALKWALICKHVTCTRGPTRYFLFGGVFVQTAKQNPCCTIAARPLSHHTCVPTGTACYHAHAFHTHLHFLSGLRRRQSQSRPPRSHMHPPASPPGPIFPPKKIPQTCICIHSVHYHRKTWWGSCSGGGLGLEPVWRWKPHAGRVGMRRAPSFRRRGKLMEECSCISKLTDH